MLRSMAMMMGGLCMAATAQLQVEDLGSPVRILSLGIQVVTPTAKDGHIAWGWRKQEALVGVHVDSGETFQIDMRKYRAVNVAMTKGPDGSLFFYAGNPGRFFRRTPTGDLVELGIAAKPASYWIGGHHSPDDVLYVGTYPGAILVACDLKTGEVTSYGRLSEDRREKYCLSVAASTDGYVYGGVGLHHQELWAVNLETREKRQILPRKLFERQGRPDLWTGTDGQVYGRSGGISFRCRPDGIDEGETCAPRRHPMMRRAGDWLVTAVDDDGKLVLKHARDNTESRVQTDYEGRSPNLYSVGCVHDGHVYGGTVFPGRAFRFDMGTGTYADMPRVAHGAIQIYDIADHPQGLFYASYMGCILDRYDPDEPVLKGRNPRRIARRVPGHERPVQWEIGPDGNLYFGTVPAKGRLGGALVRVDPETDEVQVWDNILPDQSIHYLTSIPETGELFGTGSVRGGSSAIPTLTEGEVFLWNVEEKQVVWRGKPVPGTTSYLRAVRAPNGLVVGVTTDSWYLFDPATRAALHVADMPHERLRFPFLSDKPLGKDGLIVGVGGDAVYGIDAEQKTMRVLGRHPTLSHTHGFLATEDGWLYYGSGSKLYRCKLDVIP